jgi:hypothetical protein
MTLSAAIADKPLWNVLAIGPAEKGFRKVCQLWQHRRCAPSGMGVPRSPIPARNQAPGGAPDGAIMEPGEVALGSVKDSCVPVRVRPACVLVFADPKKILGTGGARCRPRNVVGSRGRKIIPASFPGLCRRARGRRG